MGGMFYSCNALTSLDVSRFNTSQVTRMDSMFSGCKALTSLNVTGFDTSNVTNMQSMFYGCNALTSLDVSRFNTSNVTNMSNMFSGCSKLTSLDVSGFDTSNVTDMSSMFSYCRILKSLDVSRFDTAKVTKMNNMFYNCNALSDIDVSGFDTPKVTDMNSMFASCSSLTNLDISSFDMSKVTSKPNMFSGTNNLKSLTLGEKCNISGTALPAVPTTSKKWHRTDDPDRKYTSAELMNNYNSSMAGTWVWDVAETEGFVNYNAGLGTTTAKAVTVTSSNPSVTVPAASTTKRPHYILAGWSKNPNATTSDTLYTPGQTYNDIAVMGEATTLYAVWEPTNLRDYTVKHYKEKSTLDGYSLTTTETLQADYGTSVTPDRKTYTGFTTPPAQTGVVAEDDSLVIEYYYDNIRDVVKFDGNGATSGVMEDQTFIYNVSQKLSPATYSRKGHVFTGWNTKADGTGTSYTDQQSIAFTPANTTETTLYAQWLDNSDNQMDVQNGVVYVTMKAGQTIVIPDLPAGTAYTIEEVNNPDWWEESASSNKTGLIEPNQTDESSITNTYKNEGSIQLVAHKKMNGRNLQEGEFAFQLIQDGNVIDTQTNGPVDTEPYIYTEQGQMVENPWYGTAPITFNAITLQNITTAGELHYTIKEIAGSDSSVTYDSHEEAVTVRYSSGAHGKINMTAVYDSNGALFENSINPGKLTFSKAVTEGSPTDQTFNFTVNLKDQNNNPITDEFPATVTGEDNHIEQRTETITRYSHTANIADDGTNSGNYANSLSTKDVVTIPGAGSLHVKVTYATEDNWDMLYIFQGEYTGNVTRNMNAGQLYKLMGGRNTKSTVEYDIPGDTATFAFYSDGSNVYYGYYAVITAERSYEYETDKLVTTVSNGSVLSLKKGDTAEITGLPGGTSYTITEESKPGWSIVSSEGSTGSIPYGGNAQVNFVNAYNAEGSAIITATKHLTGAELTDGMFTFELLDKDMNVIQAKTNDATGNIIFDAIDYGMSDVGKTYTYFIREHAGEDTTYRYDNTVYTANVTVTDNGSGTLNAEVTYPDGTPVFENSVTKSISVSKQVTGSMGNRNDSFEFTLELTGAETSSITVTKNGSVMNSTPVSGKYTFTMKHGDTVTFDGIGSGVDYKITETSANKKNYITSVDKATTGTIQNEDVSVTFTNRREVTVNTGVNTDWNIMLLALLAMTGVAGLVVMRKRKQR